MVPGVTMAAAVAIPLAVKAGFTSTSRSLFVGLALVALAVVVARDERPLAGPARSPALLALYGLGALAVGSAAWAVGDVTEAVRAGLVVGALAAVALVAAWVTRVHGIAWVVALIAVLAVAEAILGLASVALREEPFAQRIGGSWRPGGTLEYPPALAVLQISALPAFAWAMLRGGLALRLAGAAAAALAGAVIVTADSRLAVGLLAGLLLAGALAGLTRGSRRGALLLAAGAAIALVAAVGAFATASGPGAEPVSGFDHGRTAEWGVAIDAALERPLLGAGADSYAFAAAQEGGGGTLYAHSLPFEAWAELGPLGLLTVIALFAAVGSLVWRLRHDPRAWLVVPAVVGFLLANLLDWTWHLAGAAAVWALALGALLALDAERC